MVRSGAQGTVVALLFLQSLRPGSSEDSQKHRGLDLLLKHGWAGEVGWEL